MQLKFSASMISGRFSISEHRDEADWIVKMPTNAYPRLPENEFAVMSLARAIGINVPQIELGNLDSIRDLPSAVPSLRGDEAYIYAIRRFDRTSAERVHAEDFNQIAAQKPDEKYDNKTTAFVGNVIGQLCEQTDVEEFVRRVVFGVLIGNDDMHLKNWALTYPDGRHAKIAPLYDFVCSRTYFPDGELALTIGGERRFARITRAAMRDFAGQAEISAKKVLRLADDVCERIRAVWPDFKKRSPTRSFRASSNGTVRASHSGMDDSVRAITVRQFGGKHHASAIANSAWSAKGAQSKHELKNSKNYR